MAGAREHYTAVAIVLHWAIAAAILINLPLGFWMHEQAEGGIATQGVFAAFQLHKSIGLTVLALSLARLGWRLANPPPPLPAHMPGWERVAAKTTHWAFYALMLGLPLSGWLFVSAGWSLHEDRSLAVPTHWFGIVEVPALFNLAQASPDVRENVAEATFRAHAVMAWLATCLAALHVAAALKHHVIDRDSTLAHMIPGLRASGAAPAPASGGRSLALGAGLGLVAVGVIAAALSAASLVGAGPGPQRDSTIEIAAPQQSATPSTPTTTQTPVQTAAPEPNAPAVWRVDSDASSIQFSYLYVDETGESRLQGRFTRWRADIRFDPEDLEASSAIVTIETASGTTGAALNDRTMAGGGWFDAAAHPTATFRTSDIRRSGDGYEARGELTIRERTRNVRLPFTLEISGDRAVMDGRVSVDRRDFALGEGADGDDLVGREVTIAVHVVAVRAP